MGPMPRVITHATDLVKRGLTGGRGRGEDLEKRDRQDQSYEGREEGTTERKG